jgi:aminopeptidase N
VLLKKYIIIFFSLLTLLSKAQYYNRADELRGNLSPLRSCYDVIFYNLNIKINIPEKSIAGSNTIYYKILNDFDKIQIDLFANMQIDSILHQNKKLTYTREYNAVFIYFGEKQLKNNIDNIIVYYHGKPKIAVRPPWEGGFVWTQDKKGNDWVAVACENIGASLWYPNKDHLSDKPDSMMISCTVPSNLKCISNGNLINTIPVDNNSTKYVWFISYPILNYNATICIGNYINFYDYYIHDNDSLRLDYYVFDYNLDKAKKQFKQVKPLLKCYEKFFGPYPFPKDGYALIETPFAGMEHQSAIAYGNYYKNGYAGEDYSLLNLDFDYIIIHETGHEWWGNSLSMGDLADMWIHEAFTTYAEMLYVDCMYGSNKALQYINMKKNYVLNDAPCIPEYNLNKEGSQDMYSKGALMLHTIRNVIDDDKIWFDILLGLQKDFKYKTVNYNDIVNYMNLKSGKNLSKIFNQYLKHKYPPLLHYSLKKQGPNLIIKYKWEETIDDFDMPVKIYTAKNKLEFIYPITKSYKETVIKNMKPKDFKIALDLFFIYTITD